MTLIILLIGLVFALLMIRKHKFMGVGLSIFFLLELLFRDFGLWSSSLNLIWQKLLFLIATLVLCISLGNILSGSGDEDKC